LDLEPVVVVVPVPLALLLLVLLLVLLFLVFLLLPLLVLPVPPVSVVAIAARPAAAARAGPPAHRAEWLGIERLVRKYGPSEGFERTDEIYAPFVRIAPGLPRSMATGPPRAAKCELVRR
jgi:hypothetical protein